MQHLSTIRASMSSFGCDAGYAGIDLFTRDERYRTLQTEVEELRHLLRQASCSLVRLSIEGEAEERLAIVSGWPTPWHAGRITLNEVTADDEVRLSSRVVLAFVPRPLIDGESTLVKDSSWILVRGKARWACLPLSIRFGEHGCGAVRAEDVSLPKGVTLASPPEQVLFRIEQAAFAPGAIHA